MTPHSSAAAPERVLISYAEGDEHWLRALRTHLAPLEAQGVIHTWDTSRHLPGSDEDERRCVLNELLTTTRVAVLLISKNFLASPAVRDEEFPRILEAAQARGLRVVPIHVGAALVELLTGLESFPPANPPDQPLDALPLAGSDAVLRDVARGILGAQRTAAEGLGGHLPWPRAWIAAGAFVLVAGLAAWRLGHRPPPAPESPPPLGMVAIPGGTFLMGSQADEIDEARRRCRAAPGALCRDEVFRRESLRQVRLSPFLLDATEVTNQRFAEWLARLPTLRQGPTRTLRDAEAVLIQLDPRLGGITLVGQTPTVRPGFAARPVVGVTWHGACGYCRSTFMTQAMGLRTAVTSGTEEEIAALLTACFGLAADEVDGATAALRARYPR